MSCRRFATAVFLFALAAKAGLSIWMPILMTVALMVMEAAEEPAEAKE